MQSSATHFTHTQQPVTLWSTVKLSLQGFVLFCREVLRCWVELGHDHFQLLCNYSLIMPTSNAVNNLRYCKFRQMHHKCYYCKCYHSKFYYCKWRSENTFLFKSLRFVQSVAFLQVPRLRPFVLLARATCRWRAVWSVGRMILSCLEVKINLN